MSEPRAAKPRSVPETSKARVLIVGDVMLDRYWFGDASRVSPEAPVPVVLVEREEARPGGAANVARNCVALGAATRLLSVIGEDEHGRRLAELVDAAGVQASFHTDASIPTTVKLRVIARQQQLLRIDFETPPSSEVLASTLVEFEQALPLCDVVILSDYGKGGLAHIERMIGLARDAGRSVLVDPKGDDYARYRGASMVTPNRTELREVVGTWKDEADLARRVEVLRAKFDFGALLVTRSEHGMSLFRAEGAVHVAAHTREVYDVSGAGDTVIAALGVMMAAGVDLQDAMHIANRAAGIVVGKLGTAVATREELFGSDA